MFDKYIIDPASVTNLGPADAPTGFSFATKLGYYRGLGLSMIEDLAVSIDGEQVPRSAIRFDEGPGPLTLDEMETAYDRRWAFGAQALILVDCPGGFPAGEHRLTLQQRLRISYLPFPSFNNDEKVIIFAAV
ncbi:C-glycoside deglycosidase beta subunit domain-containing protein [Rhizorhabdus sp. FW153]|uniref:C-glycoside deglycosidase beta subunit domain-containing protein n=1 Tax=Rhizorhabdus sp. FW153 TaxID=3400216 RepID=UPI003CE92C3B